MIEPTSIEEARALLNSDKLVLVDFSASWCGPCKALTPVLKAIAEERSDVLVVKVDIDEMSELAMDAKVRSVPTLQLLKNGQVIGTKVGALPKSAVIKFIEDGLSTL